MSNNKTNHTTDETDDILNDALIDEYDDTDDVFDVSDDEPEETDADAVFDAKEKKRKVNSIIRKIVLVVALAVFVFAAYNLISIMLEYKKGNDIYTNIEHEVVDDSTPATITIGGGDGALSHEVQIPFKYDHNALLSINEEGIGYLYIPALDLRLPMVQSTDNDFYLTHTFDKTYNSNGCLFEDYRIKDGLKASNVIIYGHNMNNGSMFGRLSYFKTYSYWNSGNNNVFYIYTGNTIKEYKIFSVYNCEPICDTYTFNFGNLSQMREYAQQMKDKSIYDTGVDVSNATQVVTLSTCSSNGSMRLIVHGVYTGEATLN